LTIFPAGTEIRSVSAQRFNRLASELGVTREQLKAAVVPPCTIAAERIASRAVTRRIRC
jgi:hypothetical protein